MTGEPPLGPQEPPLRLGFGLSFSDLYDRDGLLRVDESFLTYLDAAAPAIAPRLRAARMQPDALGGKAEAALLIELSPAVDAFVGALFGIGDEIGALRAKHTALAPLYEAKTKFVKRQALLKVDAAQLDGFDPVPARRRLREFVAATLGAPSGSDRSDAATTGTATVSADSDAALDELALARAILEWQRDEAAFAEPLQLAMRYAAWAVTTDPGQALHGRGVLFRQPGRIEPLSLIGHLRTDDVDGVPVHRIDDGHLRRRLDNGRGAFSLTDAGTGLAGALDETHYCILCHNQAKDSCSKGLREKPAADGSVAFKRSALGIRLAGCPLEQRISEFHTVKRDGHAVAALAMIVIDNPLCAATGHRICNDCMKACIYQKQTPVDIPQAETRTLKDVLELPWGFEVYSLLTRWNPLNLRRPLPLPDTGYKVLVVGMGPAGFALAHHLINDGHAVYGIDGLKIEPLPPVLAGVDADGARRPFAPVHSVATLFEDLDRRVMAGFGGVAEYGITVRWDKNFLKIVRLLLERRSRFAMAGGVRFGGTLTLADVWAWGFDHVALAMGAGRPTTLEIPNGLARGVRTASDFLMALQLTGAAKADSIANMQLRLPVVVVGGGLTAIDTATESLAYYVVQVEKFLARHESLCAMLGAEEACAAWTADERAVADEFIAHARAIRNERDAAAAERRPARIAELLQRWGGVTIAYRKRLVDSPSYTLNHEEVEKALEEGIRFAEGLSPTRIDVDDGGAVVSITMARQRRDDDGRWHDDGELSLPARTVFIAAGTQPNTVLAREDPTSFALDGRYFGAIGEDGEPVHPEPATSKPRAPQVLLGRSADDRFVSFFGDQHPSYFGNVVKAMGSAKQGFPTISRVLRRRAPTSIAADALAHEFNRRLRAHVVEVRRLTPTIVEVIVHAPQAAARFEPGQFYRLQNFETCAPVAQLPGAAATRLAMEGLALTGAWVDKPAGLVSLIVLEMGGSSDLCRLLRAGEPVVLMGPTGAPTEIAAGETVVLVGGGLGNAVLFSIGAAFRAHGSQVLYFAGYKRIVDRYKVEDIEAAADIVVWCCDEAPGFAARRPQDRTFVGNIVDAMSAFGSGALGDAPTGLRLQDARRIVAIGSDRMMAAVAAARHGLLRPYLRPDHVGIGSINSPMQCMMKEICAQCLQPHRDPGTGRIRYVFSCFNQDQPLDEVDFDALNQRLRQNSLQEKQCAAWIARCIGGDTGSALPAESPL